MIILMMAAMIRKFNAFLNITIIVKVIFVIMTVKTIN